MESSKIIESSPIQTNHIFWQEPELSEVQIDTYFHLTERIVLEVGNLLREGYYRNKEIGRKSGRELVTSADIASERLIRSRIESAFPDHKILSEELGNTQAIDVENLWVVDPLDGTNNFAHSFPFFSVSIAFVHKGSIVLGVVYDPLRQEIFSSTRTGKSYMNGEKLSVSAIDDISQAIIATGFPYDLAPETENNLDNFINVSYAAQGIRRAGSAALDLCYVAAGRLDGFWELKLKPWDMAAGALIAKNAGGIVTDFDKTQWLLSSDRIVTANSAIHKSLIEIIQ